uniref:Uncharacterized protein n=1 Tax=Tetraselmis sp. GSL018 TaxID=582737 RepID=A0A061RS41_9CHLO
MAEEIDSLVPDTAARKNARTAGVEDSCGTKSKESDADCADGAKRTSGRARTKLCPVCNQSYGTKMGGKPGGTQCTNMIPSRDDQGNVLVDNYGNPILVQCPHVFMSSKQSLVVKRKSEGVAAVREQVPSPKKLKKTEEAPSF